MMKQLQKQLLEGARLPTPQLAAQEAAVHATASWSSEAMLRLEPEQPQSWFLAATLHTERQRPASMREALEMNFRAIQLAQQQRSSLWVIKAGFSAVMMVAGQRTCRCADVDRPTLESALALAQQLPSELKRCRRVLPEVWVKQAEALVAASQVYAATIQGHLEQLLQTGTGAGSSGVGTAGNDSLSLKEVQAMAAAASQSRMRSEGTGAASATAAAGKQWA